jgi:hypothetical protein
MLFQREVGSGAGKNSPFEKGGKGDLRVTSAAAMLHFLTELRF